MLTQFWKIWEKYRGYDQWIETDASIKDSSLTEEVVAATRSGEPIYEWEAYDTITWKDTEGNEHSDEFKVSENSKLFQLYDGLTIKIKYNPEDPGDYYYEDLAKNRFYTALKGILIAGFVMLYVIIYALVRYYSRHQ